MLVAPRATAQRTHVLRQHCIHVEWPYISEPIALPLTRQMQITTAFQCQFNNNDKNELKEKKQDDRRYITWLKQFTV